MNKHKDVVKKRDDFNILNYYTYFKFPRINANANAQLIILSLTSLTILYQCFWSYYDNSPTFKTHISLYITIPFACLRDFAVGLDNSPEISLVNFNPRFITVNAIIASILHYSSTVKELCHLSQYNAEAYYHIPLWYVMIRQFAFFNIQWHA